MNFNRASLKTRAKRILRKNWGWAVLVTLILSIVSPTVFNSFLSDQSNSVLDFRNNMQIIQNNQNDGFSTDNGVDINRYKPGNRIERYKEEVDAMIRTIIPDYPGTTWVLFLSALLFAFLIFVVLKIFIFNPLYVGCMKWYLRNRTEDQPKLRAIVEVFGEGYLRIVWIMFLRDLFTFLWTLLFIIPGIIKSYEYRMIPFLLAENPNFTVSEAFDKTKKIMYGNKMDTFILDLSFFPWIILASFTCGLLSLLYVEPYMALTKTELYVCLCQGKERYEMS